MRVERGVKRRLNRRAAGDELQLRQIEALAVVAQRKLRIQAAAELARLKVGIELARRRRYFVGRDARLDAVEPGAARDEIRGGKDGGEMRGRAGAADPPFQMRLAADFARLAAQRIEPREVDRKMAIGSIGRAVERRLAFDMEVRRLDRGRIE